MVETSVQALAWPVLGQVVERRAGKHRHQSDAVQAKRRDFPNVQSTGPNRQPEGGAADEAQCQADAVDGGVGPSLGRGVSRKFGHRRSGSAAVTTRTGMSGHTAGRWTIGCVSNSASGAKGVLHH